MSLHIDALAELITDSVKDSNAAVGDWLQAIDQAFGAHNVEAERLGEWKSAALPKEIHDCLTDREDDQSLAAAEFVRENKFDDPVWFRINKLLDEFDRVAAGDYD